MSEKNRKKREKLENLESLVEKGVNPYNSHKYDRTHKCKEVVENFSELKDSKVKVCGRIKALRTHGKIAFIDLEDSSGEVQLVFKEDSISGDKFDLVGLLGRGDFLGAEGKVFKTEKGEKSVKVWEFEVLSKCLRNLPPEKEGLQDPEKRYRQRYLDLLTNKEVKEIFDTRHQIVKSMREFMDSRGFIEVETPILQEIYGGALARPFKTQHNTLDREFYLRISNELYLKRLIVGGYEKVYEIVKDFRNEGIDTSHNPEFTQMEFYWAYADYKKIMDIAEELVSYIAREVLETTEISYNGEQIDLSPPWNRIRMTEALEKYADIKVEEMNKQELISEAKKNNLEVRKNVSWGELVEALFEELVEDNLIEPTFIYDYPVDVSPLAKRKRGDKRFTERFEIFIAGEEFGNAYSELNDPVEQKKRFEEQVQKRKEGDLEAHEMDEDYIRALEYGMPPTGGFGIGIDRLTMLLTDKQSIKEVIAFPQLARMEGAIDLHSDIVKDKVFK